MKTNNKPIGIFDSGIGGFTVLKELKKLLPKEDFVYVADNKNNPFGDKSVNEILTINDKVISFLLNKEVKLIVVACNTSSSLALEHDKDLYPVPFVDMLLDGLWFTKDLPPKNKIGIIATSATVKSNSYLRIINLYNPDLLIQQKASPKLVPLIENVLFKKDLSNKTTNKDLLEAVKEYVDGFKSFENIILGCSHYPYITNYIKNIMPKINIIDPSYYVAKRVFENLENIGQNNKKQNDVFYYTKENITILENAKSFGFRKFKKVNL